MFKREDIGISKAYIPGGRLVEITAEYIGKAAIRIEESEAWESLEVESLKDKFMAEAYDDIRTELVEILRLVKYSQTQPGGVLGEAVTHLENLVKKMR